MQSGSKFAIFCSISNVLFCERQFLFQSGLMRVHIIYIVCTYSMHIREHQVWNEAICVQTLTLSVCT